jgi:hypothetical protein
MRKLELTNLSRSIQAHHHLFALLLQHVQQHLGRGDLRGGHHTDSIAERQMLRLSSLPSVELSAVPMKMLLNAKSGARRSWKPQADSVAARGRASRRRRCVMARSPR